MTIPNDWVKRIRAIRGEPGAAWLVRLPGVLSQCAERFALRIDSPFPSLSYNYVAPAKRSDGTTVVLKVGLPDDPELISEVHALRDFNGRGAVRLLDHDPALGALLLEHIVPGTVLTGRVDRGQDREATSLAALVMQQLWRPVSNEFPHRHVSKDLETFARLRATYGGSSGPLPAKILELAERLTTELLASAEDDEVLLHADLHHDNILEGTDRWIAIDPKGCIGERAYDCGALLRNPRRQLLAFTDLRSVLATRIDILAEHLALDRARITGWGIAQAVLSACWSLEENDEDHEIMHIATTLASIAK